ncbi:MAG TPA: hypothetical protein VIL20_01425 [Sandaracinaceae bacterium]
MSRYRRELGGARRTLACSAVLSLLAAATAAAQQEGSFVDRFRSSIAESVAPRWTGPRVPWPEPSARPRSGGVLRSMLYPVAVQIGSEAVDAEQARRVLAALERAHAWLEERGWPTPPPDGGYGGTAGFDLYVVDSIEGAAGEPEALEEEVEPLERWAAEGLDAPNAWAPLDAAITHARIDADLDPVRLDACVLSVYVRAALLAHDPAEAPAWRDATGDYVAWLATGQFGCSDAGLIRAQREPWRTWIGHGAPGHGGALFLAMLSARTDGLTGDFIRDLWSGAPQLTWEGEGLRAAPDMWQVVHAVMEVGRDPLPRLLEEMAVARWFAGDPERLSGAPLAILREVPKDAVVPLVARTRWADLPRRFEPHDLELEPLGSAYLLVDTAEAPAGSTLRIWLRGEYGVGWALNAVRLGAGGEERGRVRAPVRPRTPRSYIPLELTDGATAQVLVVVTNMGGRLVDADAPNDQVRSFSVVFDKVEPGANE